MRNLFIAFVCLLFTNNSEAKIYAKVYTGISFLSKPLSTYGAQIGYRNNGHIIYTELSYGSKQVKYPSGIYEGIYYENGPIEIRRSASVLNIGYAYRFFKDNNFQIQPFVRVIGEYSVDKKINNLYERFGYFSIGTAVNLTLYKKQFLSTQISYTPQRETQVTYTGKKYISEIGRSSLFSISIGLSL